MSTEVGNKEQSSESSNVVAQGGTVAGMTLFSRITGLVRDMAFSFFFGATELADAFFVAFRIPNFFRSLFAEGAFIQAFVPVLAEYRDKEKRDFQEFIASILGGLLALLFPIILAGVLFSPAFVMVFAPGFWHDETRFGLARDMLRITFPYLGFISLTALSAAILNSHNRYALPAFTPVLLNLVLISAVLFASDSFANPVYALAWAVLVAGIIQFLFQLPSLHRLGFIVRPRLDFRHIGVKKVQNLLGPGIFAASVNQINSLIDTILASTLVAGSISWLYYSARLFELPIGILAVALGTVLLPNLSRLHNLDKKAGFSDLLDWGLRIGWMFGLPAAVAIYFLAFPLISTIFYRGAMTSFDVEMASLSLQAFAIGLPGFVFAKILAPGYFAMQNTKTPFRFALISVATNIVINLSLFSWLGHIGLAIGTAAAGWVNAILLFGGLIKDRLYIPEPNILYTFLRAFFGAALMIIFLVVFNPDNEVWLLSNESQRFILMTFLVFGGALVYFLTLFLFGERIKRLMLRV